MRRRSAKKVPPTIVEEEVDDNVAAAVQLQRKYLELESLRESTMFRLETGLEEIRFELDRKISCLSESVQDLFRGENSKALTNGRGQGNRLSRKVFAPQQSLLSKMLSHEEENYKTIFNICIVCLFLWGASLAFDDFMNSGLPNWDLLVWGLLRDFEPFVKRWICFPRELCNRATCACCCRIDEYCRILCVGTLLRGTSDSCFCIIGVGGAFHYHYGITFEHGIHV